MSSTDRPTDRSYEMVERARALLETENRELLADKEHWRKLCNQRLIRITELEGALREVRATLQAHTPMMYDSVIADIDAACSGEQTNAE